jgi:hypothetical protein
MCPPFAFLKTNLLSSHTHYFAFCKRFTTRSAEMPDSPIAREYILVQHKYDMGQFGSPKNRESRRVDMTKQRRKVLMERKESASQSISGQGRPASLKT